MTRHSLPIAALLTAACAGLLAQAAMSATASNSTGKTVATQDRVMSFWMPLMPKKSTGVVEHDGPKRRWTKYSINVRQYAISASMFELTGTPNTGSEQALLEGLSKEFLMSLGPDFIVDKVDGKTALLLGPRKLQGLQLKSTQGVVRSRMQTFIGTCRIYMLQVTHALNDRIAEQVADRFFKSLAVRDPVSKTCVLSPD